MAGSRRRRQLKRQQAPAKRTADVVRVNFVDRLSHDLLANIHGRLGSLDRVAFALVCKTAGHPMNPPAAAATAPWIVFPGASAETATFFPLADRRAATARTADLGTRGHVVVGSSFGWLATADELGALHIVDPVTGERARLPDARTFPFMRYSRSCSIEGHYHVDTAIFHHDGRFYSVSCSGAVEAWERDGVTGDFTSKPVAVARIMDVEDFVIDRKYIAAKPDGQLVLVVKYTREEAATGYYDKKKWSCAFVLQELDAARGQWKMTTDIGDAALFVGMSSSIFLPTAAHPGIKPGCVYFADDELHQAAERRHREAANGYHSRDEEKGDHGPQHVGVYNLTDGTVEVVEGLGRQSWSSPPVWFTPSL